MQAQLAYWQEQLRESWSTSELPTDHPRGTAVHVRTARQPLELPRTLYEALTHLGQQEGSTLFMTCLAAFQIFLYGYTGQTDLRVATLVANRTRRETEGLIGLVVNTVILRTDFRGNPTCREVLQRVRATMLAAYAHQELPFEDLVQTLEHEHHLQRTSLCQVLVLWQNAMLQPLPSPAPTLRFETMEQSIMAPEVALTTFDIILIFREKPHGFSGTCIYKTDLFEAMTIRRMLDDFQYVLTCLSTQPERELAIFRSLCSARG